MDREYLHSMLEARDYDIQNAVQGILKSSDELDASMFTEEASRSQAYSFVLEEETKVRNSKITPKKGNKIPRLGIIFSRSIYPSFTFSHHSTVLRIRRRDSSDSGSGFRQSQRCTHMQIFPERLLSHPKLPLQTHHSCSLQIFPPRSEILGDTKNSPSPQASACAATNAITYILMIAAKRIK
jgi:hypothetical protein